jgi:TMEM175 potassium channel family protein
MTEAATTTTTDVEAVELVQDDDVKRLSAFCDAVMAIAMTLLVLDLDKPDPKAITSTAQLHDALDQWSAYASFALSFWVIAIYWRVHFRAFRRFRRVDGTVLQLTLLFLFGITFLPFPTAILQRFSEDRVAVLLYSGTLAAVGYSWAALWYYSVRKGHLVLRAEDGSVRVGLERCLIPPSVFVLSFCVAWIDPALGLWAWLLLPISGLFRRIISRKRSHA